MNVIAFLSQKGGSGKTTLSVHTAVTEFEAEGKAAEEIRALWAWIKDTLERK